MITQFAIERFRSLRQLKLEGLGRVNLITGRNNTGKSSVLEALRIFAWNASPAVIWDILLNREEDIGRAKEPGRPADAEILLALGNIFTGFPHISEFKKPIVIAVYDGKETVRLDIALGYFGEQREADGSLSIVPQRQTMPRSELAQMRTLVVKWESQKSGHSSASLDRFRQLAQGSISLELEEPRLPCAYVSPYGGERTANLGSLWDGIALSDHEKEVVEALQIIAPDIMAVSMVGSGGLGHTRTAIVRSKIFNRPVPLRSYGDGLNRLFGIVLALVNAKDGLLLIDEFENGMHYSVQLDVWRGILRLAERLNVQVFATSHSWDAVEAFQKAVGESQPDAGVLVRLTRRGEDVIPTVLQNKELAIATRDRIEVR